MDKEEETLFQSVARQIPRWVPGITSMLPSPYVPSEAFPLPPPANVCILSQY